MGYLPYQPVDAGFLFHQQYEQNARTTPPPIDIWYSSFKIRLTPIPKEIPNKNIIPRISLTIGDFLFHYFVQGGLRTCCGTCWQVYSRNFVMEILLLRCKKLVDFNKCYQVLYPKRFFVCLMIAIVWFSIDIGVFVQKKWLGKPPQIIHGKTTRN